MKNRYIVVWAKDSLLGETHKKTFDSAFQAQWFANQMKKSYNFVLCTEEKNWEIN